MKLPLLTRQPNKADLSNLRLVLKRSKVVLNFNFCLVENINIYLLHKERMFGL